MAHELVHVMQQGRRARSYIQRQCNPAWAGLSWADRTDNAPAMANGGTRDQCIADMMQEALGIGVTGHQSTNNSATVDAAIAAGRYTEIGNIGDRHVNFDRRLNNKTGNANQYSEARFVTSGNNIQLYAILGPRVLNPIGPQFTVMTYEHEREHTDQFLLQWATGTPHGATAGEALGIYVQNFEGHFLDLWEIDNTGCSYSYAQNFANLFSYYAAADQTARDAAFDSTRMCYDCAYRAHPVQFDEVQDMAAVDHERARGKRCLCHAVEWLGGPWFDARHGAVGALYLPVGMLNSFARAS